jgi:hypothetical protein
MDNDHRDDHRSGLINYYFVFLAIFVILIFLGIYFLQRRRRARKEAFRNSGQNALARDVDGWTSTRRWVNGHWRSNSGTDREEGLNELGQAPPPYAAKDHSREQSAGAGVTIEEPQIPLRTLARDEGDRSMAKPPEYSEAVRVASAGETGPQHQTRSPGPSSAAEGSTSRSTAEQAS